VSTLPLRACAAVALAGALLWTAPAGAQSPGAVTIEGLGTIDFEVTGAPDARSPFLRGLLLIHSFEYEPAADAFRAAQRADPAMAMAYWGEAMTHNHPLWQERDRVAALAALNRYAPSPEARQARAPTPREAAYLEAVDILFAEGEKAVRDTAYARAMARLAQRYPDDFDARAFHALALLGLNQGDRDVPTYMRAGTVALDLFDESPRHPGAAHYVIHSFDDPVHAPLGLNAAMAYSRIAPQAAHAQHMTSHIFLAMGMWEDVVAANERAVGVVNGERADAGMPPTSCGHYNEWLLYGYQQQGRYGDARAILDGCLAQAENPALQRDRRRQAARSYAWMRELYLADSRDVQGPHGRPPHAAVDDMLAPGRAAWATGLAAALRGDAAAARESLDAASAVDDWTSTYAPVRAGTLRALILADAGDLDGAIAEARAAAEAEAALPMAFGPPIAAKPPRELEGELLLEANRPEEAVTAFRQALARTPKRARSLVGLGRAAAAAGDTAVAADAYAMLAEVLLPSGNAAAELDEAKAFLARQ
jgi:tetratricopeptide (TPR) repeat protein